MESGVVSKLLPPPIHILN